MNKVLEKKKLLEKQKIELMNGLIILSEKAEELSSSLIMVQKDLNEVNDELEKLRVRQEEMKFL